MKSKLFFSVLFIIFCYIIVSDNVFAYPTIYPTGVTIHDESKAYEGYTSFAVAGVGIGNTTVYIIDMEGNVLHEWFIGNGGTLHNLVLKNGSLISNRLGGKCPVMGCIAAIEERDWYGNLIWSYENDHLHHVAEIMPNGNIIAILWDELPEELNEYVKGGIPGTEAEGDKIYTDAIIIINRDKEVVWEWYPHKQLNISDWPISYSENRQYWPNINRIEYLPEGNPFNGKESLLVSLRMVDTLAIIDMETKEVSWRWGRGEISHQHDPHLLSNGNIIVFDNGFLRSNLPNLKAGVYFSRIVEINPRINKIVWEYDGSMPGRMRGFGFYSFIGGFVERLPNWNTLITETTTGRIFEVNPQGEIVWEYVNPIANLDSVFRFGPDEIEWPEKLPPPNPGKTIRTDNLLLYTGWVVVILISVALVYFIAKRLR